MTKLIYKYGRIEKSQMVSDNYIFPSYGQKVNEFNEFLIVRDIKHKDGEVHIKLEDS